MWLRPILEARKEKVNMFGQTNIQTIFSDLFSIPVLRFYLFLPASFTKTLQLIKRHQIKLISNL